MIYAFKCARPECQHVFSQLLKTTEDRELPRKCPECGEVTGMYSFLETQRRSTVVAHFDDVHALEQKFSQNPHWQGITNTHGTREMRGKVSPGASRTLPLDPNQGMKFKGTKTDVKKLSKT